MRSVFSRVSGPASGFIQMVLLMSILSAGLVFPVSASDAGYTQGWMGVPNWVLDRMDSSVIPDSYIPKNVTSNGEEKPTLKSYINSGNTLLVSGSFAEAKQSFENAITLNPESFDAWTGRGMALEGLKRYQTALDSYERAIGFSDSKSNVWLAYAGKGRVSYKLQDYLTASKALETAIDEFAGSGESNIEDLISMYEKLAEAKQKLGEEDAAADAMKKAQDLRSAIGNTSSSPIQ